MIMCFFEEMHFDLRFISLLISAEREILSSPFTLQWRITPHSVSSWKSFFFGFKLIAKILWVHIIQKWKYFHTSAFHIAVFGIFFSFFVNFFFSNHFSCKVWFHSKQIKLNRVTGKGKRNSVQCIKSNMLIIWKKSGTFAFFVFSSRSKGKWNK